MISLANLALEKTRRGDNVYLEGNTSAGTAYDDSKSLASPAVAWMVDIGATGNIVIVELDGTSQTYDVSKVSQGAWNLHKIKGIKATGTTLANTSLRLGWNRY